MAWVGIAGPDWWVQERGPSALPPGRVLHISRALPGSQLTHKGDPQLMKGSVALGTGNGAGGRSKILVLTRLMSWWRRQKAGQEISG